MTGAGHVLTDLELKASAGEPLTADEAQRMFSTADLVSVGVVAEAARRAVSGDVVTFGRVLELAAPDLVAAATRTAELAVAGEVRLTGTPASADEAVSWAAAAAGISTAACRTGFSLADLWALAGKSGAALQTLAARLVAAGLEAVAAVPLDRFESTDDVVAAVASARAGGLGTWRATLEEARGANRLELILRAAGLQQQTSALRAFAPLPRIDPPGEPSTGYDDVRAVAVARSMCTAIRFIQVDWPLYGPKLAQVAIAFGANDVDGIAVKEQAELGRRRAPAEEISRQIRAAAATPAERNGRYEPRA